MYLITSNINKKNEFLSLGLPIEIRSGIDIKEVLADHETVAIYKALEAGIDSVIDDTILTFNGKEIVDVRWKIAELINSSRIEQPIIEWVVLLAHNTGTEIVLYKSVVFCDIDDTYDVNNPPKDSFAFDPFLRPKGDNRTFYDLQCEGIKLDFSPRGHAIRNIISNNVYKRFLIKDIPKWEGEYQNT